MTYIIIIIITFLSILYFFKVNQNRQKVNEFGSTREFLAPIIDSFEQDYIRYELTATNDGRYKAVFYRH